MVDTNKQKAITVKKIETPKPYDLLANQLRETILNGDISEGDLLPSERELVAQTGLTRGAVREALRILASEGLLQTRQGRFGGNIVTLPGKQSITTAVSQFVRGRNLPLRTLQETREIIEPALARLAAMHRTGEHLAELKKLHQALVESAGDFQNFSRLNIQWHQAVARASGNELLAALLYSISYGVTMITTTEEYDTPETRQQVIRIHARVNEAIENGEPDAAHRYMQQHIGATHALTRMSGAEAVPLSRD